MNPLEFIEVVDETPNYILLRFKSKKGDLVEVEITEKQALEMIVAFNLCGV